MAGNSDDSKDRRGLASAAPTTRHRVAQAGGKAFHAKRGAKGSDRHRPTE